MMRPGEEAQLRLALQRGANGLGMASDTAARFFHELDALRAFVVKVADMSTAQTNDELTEMAVAAAEEAFALQKRFPTGQVPPEPPMDQRPLVGRLEGLEATLKGILRG